MRLRILFLAAMLLLVVVPLSAQPADTVFAILFYSPSCPHCHTVIDEHLPVMDAEFGDQLQVIGINVTVPAGGALFNAACDAFDTQNRCGGVPMMLIGETIMIGSYEIPTLAPDLIREGIANGGIPIADFEGSQEMFNQWLLVYGMEAEESNTAGSDEAATTAEATDSATASVDASVFEAEELSIWERFNQDTEANMMAIAVLLGLVASIASVFWLGQNGKLDYTSSVVKLAFAIGGGASLFVVGSILLNGGEDTGVLIAAGAVLLLLLAALVMYRSPETRRWCVPTIAVAGLIVASYLAYVEVSEVEAVCGALGDCNTVQQSAYAKLFGVLPIGVLGVIGYIGILLAWGLTQANENLRQLGQGALLLLTLVGAAFSVYLTFLEPFVIGATCAWCLTSALTMLLLLWLVAPLGWNSLQNLRSNSV